MTARVTNRTERLVKMEQLLFRNAAGMRAVELAEACDVDRRTVYRDLSLLNEVGVPIYQKDGRFCLEREQYLATIRLSFNETVALLLTASMSKQKNPHLASAMEKLSHALPEHIAAHANLLTDLMHSHPLESARVELFDTITRAWSEQRCVKIWYRSSRDENKLRTHEVSTYFIEPKADGAVYVVGFDSVSQRVRAFRLNRIQQAEILASSYQMPFHFDSKRYVLYLRDSAKTHQAQKDGVQR